MTGPWIPATPLDDRSHAIVRRRAIFDADKWDPQVGDTATIARYPLLITREAWAEVSALAEALAQRDGRGGSRARPSGRNCTATSDCHAASVGRCGTRLPPAPLAARRAWCASTSTSPATAGGSRRRTPTCPAG